MGYGRDLTVQVSVMQYVLVAVHYYAQSIPSSLCELQLGQQQCTVQVWPHGPCVFRENSTKASLFHHRLVLFTLSWRRPSWPILHFHTERLTNHRHSRSYCFSLHPSCRIFLMICSVSRKIVKLIAKLINSNHSNRYPGKTLTEGESMSVKTLWVRKLMNMAFLASFAANYDSSISTIQKKPWLIWAANYLFSACQQSSFNILHYLDIVFQPNFNVWGFLRWRSAQQRVIQTWLWSVWFA